MSGLFQNKIAPSIFVDRIVVPVGMLLPVVLATRYLGESLTWQSAIQALIKPLLIIAFIWRARPPKKSVINFQSCFGITVSFLAPCILSPASTGQSALLLISGTAAGIFYFIMLGYGMLKLGRNFGVAPSLRNIVEGGPFKLVRHPIYSCYLHLTIVFVTIFLTWMNALSLLILWLGLFIRAREEEKILMHDPAYKDLMLMIKCRFFSPWFSFPSILVLLVAALSYFGPAYSWAQSKNVVVAQLGNPVLSLDPLVYDDWASVFVGNHLYPRFVAEPTRPWIPFVAHDLQIICSDPLSKNISTNCKKVQVEFFPKPFNDCMGRSIDRDTIQTEFFKTLRKKTWILPGWAPCKASGKTSVCVTAKNVSDIPRRLQNLYLRFGWSKTTSADLRIGSGPYCLTKKTLGTDGIQIREGELTPISTLSSDLPVIQFFDSVTNERFFNIGLYGTHELLKEKRVNVHSHTPLAYYSISHPRWAKVRTPWNSLATKKLVATHLVKSNILFDHEMPELAKLVPAGKATEGPWAHEMKKTDSATVFLPDYLPNCDGLATKLSQSWRDYPKIIVKCVDISSYTDKFIRTEEVRYDVFISPLSPGAPGRDAIRYQYFSADSQESWTKQHKNSEELFYLIGMGQSLVTVDGEKFCGLKPSSMGMGDIAITDFEVCR